MLIWVSMSNFEYDVDFGYVKSAMWCMWFVILVLQWV